MRKIYTNLYKRSDVFSCPHSSHQRFGSAVTPYHVLHEKKCYPDGCMVFLWKCRLLDKGHACPKRLKHVGRLCFSCKQFFDEKFQQSPRLTLSDEDYRRFCADLEEFDLWLDSIVGRELEIDATITAVKPNLRVVGSSRGERYVFSGWLAVLSAAYVNFDMFDDFCFARLSEKTQSSLHLGSGSRVLCRATPTFDRGRLVFTHVHRVELTEEGDQPEWTRSGAEVAAASASALTIQTEKCMECRYGCLIDRDKSRNDGKQRTMLCLAGQTVPSDCVYPLAVYAEHV